jgi:hypothetical protein
MFDRLSTSIYRGLTSYDRARFSRQLHLWWLSLIAIYTPFEEFWVSLLPVPEAVKTGIRFIPELIIYLLFIQMVYSSLIRGKPWKSTPIDVLIIAFFASSLISLVLNQASLFGSLANLRSIWRYLAVYYLLVNTVITKSQITQFLNIFKTLALIQAAFASVQLLIPAETKVAMAGGNCEKAIFKNASCGTFVDSANLSAFLILGIIITVTVTYAKCSYLIPPLGEFFQILLLYLGLFASKKRAGLIIGLLIVVLIFTYFKRKRKAAKIAWIISALAIAIVFIYPLLTINLDIGQREIGDEVPDITSYFFTIFSPEYWDHTLSASRGWVMSQVCQNTLESGSWFGFGPNTESVINNMGKWMTSGDVIKLERDIEVFDDPYWFAIIGYFGIVGLSIYWWILLRLYIVSKNLMKITTVNEYKNLAIIFCTLVILAFVYSFSERILKTRDFGFYFWLLAGLVVNIYNVYLAEFEKRSKMNEIPSKQSK